MSLEILFFVKREHKKKCKCLFSRTVVSINKESGIVSIPGLSGRTIFVATEYVRLAMVDDKPALHVSDTNDQPDSISD